MQPITLQQIRELPRDRYNFIIFSSNEEAIKMYNLVATKDEQRRIYDVEPNSIPLIRVGSPYEKSIYCPSGIHHIRGKTLEDSVLSYHSGAEEATSHFYKYQPITLKEL